MPKGPEGRVSTGPVQEIWNQGPQVSRSGEINRAQSWRQTCLDGETEVVSQSAKSAMPGTCAFIG